MISAGYLGRSSRDVWTENVTDNKMKEPSSSSSSSCRYFAFVLFRLDLLKWVLFLSEETCRLVFFVFNVISLSVC